MPTTDLMSRNRSSGGLGERRSPPPAARSRYTSGPCRGRLICTFIGRMMKVGMSSRACFGFISSTGPSMRPPARRYSCRRERHTLFLSSTQPIPDIPNFRLNRLIYQLLALEDVGHVASLLAEYDTVIVG